MARPDRLDVYYGAVLVGTLHDTSPVGFEYATTWLERPERMAVAAIALEPGRNQTAAVLVYFENLLPEGELRQYLAEQRKASTLFSLLLEVAGDTSGAFVIFPGDQSPEPASYEATTWPELAKALRNESASAIGLRAGKARISLAGAQDKTSIALFDDGIPRLPRGTSPSTHIVKPDIKRLTKVRHSAINETIVMLAAAKCGLPSAEVFYEPHTGSCVVRRFDRLVRPDGSLARLVQYDLCQLAGTVSEKKYEKEGGPDLGLCAELIRRYSTQPAVDLGHFVRWIFFNLYVGNNDSHAKNLSIHDMPGRGVVLAPFYDLMCTRLYPGLSREFAFSIAGEYEPGSMTQTHLIPMARQLGMRPQFLAQQAADLARTLPDALGQAVGEVRPILPHSAKTMADRMQQFILSTTRKMAARLT